jgi:hypothetical protein
MSCKSITLGGSRKTAKKVRRVRSLHNSKPAKKGTHYVVEPIAVLSNDPQIKGDLFKKYVNGKLVEQKFVTDDKVKEIVETEAKRLGNKGGAKAAPVPPANQQVNTIDYRDNTGFVGNAKNAAGPAVGFGAGLAFDVIVANAIASVFDNN